MGSRLLSSKKLGARISLAALTAQIALGSLSFGLMPTMAVAASNGPNSPDTVVNDASIGTQSWSDAGDTVSSNNSRAEANLTDFEISNYLKATDFDFAIPTGSTIDGIVVEIERQGEDSSRIKDSAVRIVKGGVIGATDKSDNNFWSSSDTTQSYGGTGDLWGETWTAEDINATNFGVALAATKANSADTDTEARVDHIRVTVHYSEPTLAPCGTNTASTYTSVDFTNADNDWDDEGNATTSNNLHARSDVTSSSDHSEYLRGLGFGFAIPTDATIDGITVCIERRQESGGGENRDHVVRLVKAGTVVGDNKAATSTNWPTTDGVATYGGAADLWGTTWTPAEINAADFGSVLSVTRTGGGDSEAFVDHVSITVHYTEAVTTGTISVVKQTEPNGSVVDFLFTGDITATLSDDESSTPLVVEAGTYSVTETAVSDWRVTSIVCDDSDSTGVTTTGVVTFNVEAGEDVVCTVTNTLLGRLNVIKVEAGDPAPDAVFNFTSTTPAEVANFSIDTAAANQYGVFVLPGTYTVNEDAPPEGWTMTENLCQGVAVTAGVQTDCAITNTYDDGVVEPVIPTCNGLEATIVGEGDGDTISGTSGVDVIVGTDGNDTIDGNGGGDTICAGDGHDEVVGEGGGDAIFGEGGNDSINGGAQSDTINGGPGIDFCHGGLLDFVSDSITNCEEQDIEDGIIVIVKDAQPDDEQDFAFTGDLGSFTLDDDEDGTLSNTFYDDKNGGLFGNDYTITETATDGWTLESIVCHDPGGSTEYDLENGSVEVDLDAGEVITCVFTNVEDEFEFPACTLEDVRLEVALDFDETEGTTANDSSLGGSMDGTHVNGPVISTDVPTVDFFNPRSLSFDGFDDYVDLANGSYPTPASFSVSAWVKPNGIGIDRQIFSKGYNGSQTEWELKTTTVDGKVSFQTYDSARFGVEALTPLTDAAWTHVVGTFDGTTWRIYLNGALDNSAVAQAPIATGRPIFVGAVDANGTPVQFWNGNIDDIRLYETALTLNEVVDLYGGACEAVPEAGPVCGNGEVESEEQCDDGNTTDGDGCDSFCHVQEGWSCETNTESDPESSCSENLASCEATEDMLAYLKLDETEGPTAEDSTVNNRDGTYGGSPLFSPSFGANGFDNGGSLSFDGTGHVTLGDTLDMGTADQSVSLWFKTAGADADFSLFSKSFYGSAASRYFLVDEGTGLYAGFHGTGIAETTPRVTGLNDNNWHHAVAVFDRDGFLTLYVDGNFGGSVDISAQAPHDMQSAFPMFLARYNDGADGLSPHPSTLALNGSIDDFRVYDRALSSDDIADLFAGQCTFDVEVPEEEDTDHDGIPDSVDNCDLVATEDQTDTDEDGIGDVCDETPDGEEDDGPVETFGLSAPPIQGGNGARRGNQMNLIRSIIRLFGSSILGENGDLPPAAFGGPGDGEFDENEAKMICTMRKALPTTAAKAIFQAVANLLATYMPHSAEAILEQLKSGEICPQPVAHLAIGPKPLAFHVDSAGYPVSSNETANKCIRGTVTLEDIRNNTDRDEDGFGYGCGRYHTGNLWKLDGVYFTWNEKSRTVTLLTDGYAVTKDVTVTQN